MGIRPARSTLRPAGTIQSSMFVAATDLPPIGLRLGKIRPPPTNSALASYLTSALHHSMAPVSLAAVPEVCIRW